IAANEVVSILNMLSMVKNRVRMSIALTTDRINYPADPSTFERWRMDWMSLTSSLMITIPAVSVATASRTLVPNVLKNSAIACKISCICMPP
ncbi:MAG: hypothetical protein ACI4S9_00820, partial [Christensenellales bacterium]